MSHTWPRASRRSTSSSEAGLLAPSASIRRCHRSALGPRSSAALGPRRPDLRAACHREARARNDVSLEPRQSGLRSLLPIARSQSRSPRTLAPVASLSHESPSATRPIPRLRGGASEVLPELPRMRCLWVKWMSPPGGWSWSKSSNCSRANTPALTSRRYAVGQWLVVAHAH